jgi:hypothetical protein
MQDKYCPTRWRGETRAKGVLRHVRGKRVNDLGRAVVQPPSAAGQPLRHDTERRTHHTIASPPLSRIHTHTLRRHCRIPAKKWHSFPWYPSYCQSPRMPTNRIECIGRLPQLPARSLERRTRQAPAQDGVSRSGTRCADFVRFPAMLPW